MRRGFRYCLRGVETRKSFAWFMGVSPVNGGAFCNEQDGRFQWSFFYTCSGGGGGLIFK